MPYKTMPFSPPKVAFFLLAFVMISAVVASANNLRIVTYNVDADTGGADYQMGGKYAGPGMIAVLEAIGAIHLGDGIAQPIDVLALQEMDAPSTTAAYIVSQLNSYYGAGTYVYDTYVDPTTGGTGGGPSGLIYNTHTVKDLAVTSLDYGSGEAPRAPLRYTLQPLAAGSSPTFYLYVSHMKSGPDSTSQDRRNTEAQQIRADSATLGPGANILYTGDFNGNPGEPYYTTLTASGSGQAFDPGYLAGLLTESATAPGYRDDYQFSTAPVYSGTASFRLVSNSYTVFGNNGSVGGNVNQSRNTALNDLGANASTILADLTTATDHLPVVADYTFTSSGSLGMIAMGNGLSTTIITGGTGTLGVTVTNSAPAGYGNLNFSLTAAPAKPGTAMSLGAATPSTGTLAPGASQAFTIPVTSTSPSVNSVFVVLTALDPNSANISLSTTASLTVLRHAWPAVLVGSGNNQRVIQGAAGITAGLVLYNAPGPGYASLDVNSLGVGVSGPTGGSLVGSGSTQPYTAALNTGTLGLQNQVFSLNVGDDHTLPGSSGTAGISAGVTLAVVTNRLVTASSADFGLVHVGAAVSHPITLSTSGDDGSYTRVTVGNAGPDANGIRVSGGARPVFNSASVTDQRTVGGIFTALGTSGGTITLPTTGEGLPGENPVNVPVTYTAQVFSGKAEWSGTSGGAWGGSNWRDTESGGPSGPAGTSGIVADTADFAAAVARGTATVTLDSAAPVVSSLVFDSSAASYAIVQGTGTNALGLASPDGSSPAAVTVISGTHSILAPLLLSGNLDVSISGRLTLGAIDDGSDGLDLILDGPGTLVLCGPSSYRGGTEVQGGTLIVSNAAALADGSDLTVGSASLFRAAIVLDAAEIADSPSAFGQSVAPVPEPGTAAILAMTAGLLAACVARLARHRHHGELS